MMRASRHWFSTLHPLVVFVYFVCAIGLALCTMHPCFLAASLLAACCYGMYLYGARRFLLRAALALPLWLAVAVINPLTSGLGLTVLFMLGGQPVTLEALVYGLCAGGMLVAVLLWFSCYSAVMTGDKFLSLFGRILPGTALMLSMVLRYIPALLRRAREVESAQRSLLGEQQGGRKDQLRRGVRLASVLMSWSLENSIETADAMRGKGYGLGRRSHYVNERFCLRDGVCLTLLLLLAAATAALVFSPVGRFRFYPFLSPLSPSAALACLPYLALLLFPLLLEGKEALQCRLSRL